MYKFYQHSILPFLLCTSSTSTQSYLFCYAQVLPALNRTFSAMHKFYRYSIVPFLLCTSSTGTQSYLVPYLLCTSSTGTQTYLFCYAQVLSALNRTFSATHK